MVALFRPPYLFLFFFLIASNTLIPFTDFQPEILYASRGVSFIYLFSFPRDTTKGLGLEEKFAFFLVNTYYYTYIIPIRLIILFICFSLSFFSSLMITVIISPAN